MIRNLFNRKKKPADKKAAGSLLVYEPIVQVDSLELLRVIRSDSRSTGQTPPASRAGARGHE